MLALSRSVGAFLEERFLFSAEAKIKIKLLFSTSLFKMLVVIFVGSIFLNKKTPKNHELEKATVINKTKHNLEKSLPISFKWEILF